MTATPEPSPSARPHRVLIAGGGFAAVEAMLALRALAGDIEIEVITAKPHFAYGPAATAQAFDHSPPLSYDFARIAADCHADHRVDRIEAVAPAARIARLASGTLAPYDSLILATGARRLARVAGALTFAGPADTPHFEAVLDDLAAGTARRILFAVPSGVTWALPLYELALLTAGYAREHHIDADIAIVTPEHAPLDIFGPHASGLVRDLLAARDVRFLGARHPERFDRDGHLHLRFEAAALPADRVIAAPRLVGRAIPGIPGSWHGFVPTDERCRVEGMDGVYAAGDMTTYPIKQGSLATQQADTIAADIAARHAGLRAGDWPIVRVLRARLIGGAQPVDLFATLDGAGRPLDARLDAACGPAATLSAAAHTKVYGRHLTPYLSARARRSAAAS